MAQFNGKVAIVTGSTQGLGKAVARLLAERGAAGIVICGRNKARGEATAKEITAAYGTKTIFVSTEQSKIEDCKNIISTADKIFGRIDTLINCAAITNRGTILNTTPELFDAMFDTNVRGPFFLIQETLKVMIREKIEGTIVNIGSMSAKAGQPFLTAYCSSKGALATLTENIAFSVLRNRILGRLIDPNEVARAVAFLASSESGLMTGANVNYDQSVWGAYEGSPHPSKAMTL